MIRYKSRKQAFIIAALVILLCLICLTGATLALFTNNPEDGTIGIITTAGNIEVDIVDEKNEQLSLVGGVLNFQPANEGDEVWFEPGAAFHTQGFKIKNKGNVSVRFRLFVSEDPNVNMEKFNEAFEVWITTNPSRTKDAQRLDEFQPVLKAGESSADTYYLVVKMKESMGNEFQNQTYTGIGVTVCAVQGNID